MDWIHAEPNGNCNGLLLSPPFEDSLFIELLQKLKSSFQPLLPPIPPLLLNVNPPPPPPTDEFACPIVPVLIPPLSPLFPNEEHWK